MPRSRWLTPEAPGVGFICRPLKIPNSVEFVALVTGALMSLQEQYNWEPYGALTPPQVSALFRDMIDSFNIGPDRSCRMIGEIVPYAGSDSPDPQFLVCNGGFVSKATYPELWALIGTTYGPDDTGNFTLPDLRGRSPLGHGEGDGLTFRAIGDKVGEENHVLSTAELPSHSHSDAGHAHSESTASPTAINGGLEAPAFAATAGLGTTGTGSANISSTGGDDSHNTMHPVLAITFLIVAL